MTDELDMPLSWRYDDWLAASQRAVAEKIETTLRENGRPARVLAVDTRTDDENEDSVDVTIRSCLTEAEAEELDEKRTAEW